jgi:hypothetical protein
MMLLAPTASRLVFSDSEARFLERDAINGSTPQIISLRKS